MSTDTRKLTVDPKLAILDKTTGRGDGTRPISNYSMASRSSNRSKTTVNALNAAASPERRAAHALAQASDYKEKMISRVNYLAKEE